MTTVSPDQLEQRASRQSPQAQNAWRTGRGNPSDDEEGEGEFTKGTGHLALPVFTLPTFN